MATVDALIAPRPFRGKDKDLEQLLEDFDSYMKTEYLQCHRQG